MIDFKRQLRTIDGEVALKIGDNDDPRFKHVVGVGDDVYNVDDEGDTLDMAGYFVNVPDGARPEIAIDRERLRLGVGVRVTHAKRGAGHIVSVRACRDTGAGFGLLFEDGSQDDADLFWSANKSLRVEEGEVKPIEEGGLEITLPPASVLKVVHDKCGPGTLVKVKSQAGKSAVLGVRPDSGRPLVWSSFKNLTIAHD